MDQPSRFSISARDLHSLLGTATAPVLVDVSRPEDFETDAFLWRDDRRGLAASLNR